MSANRNSNSNSNNENDNHAGTRKRRRGQSLLGLVCASLCANTSSGFVNLAHPSRHRPLQHHQQQQYSPRSFSPQLRSFQPKSSSSVLSVISSASASAFAETEKQPAKRHSKKTARLAPEEETELLRRAVEYRRLNQLEKDLALENLNNLPLLSVRAKHAGYGENLFEYEDAKYEGQLARETLVTHNMGLVHYCVNQIIGKEAFGSATAVAAESKSAGRGHKGGLPLNSLSREDLLQEGAIGLARAVDKWNPEIGGKFSTYAVYWVRAAVLRCIAERDDVVRVPSHVSQAVLQINKAAKRLGWILQESGGILVTEDARGAPKTSPRWKAANAAKLLAEEAGLSERRFEEAMTVRRRRYSGGYVPFEPWMQKTGRGSSTAHAPQHRGYHSDENEDHDRQRLESSANNEEIRTVLSKHLRPKEMEALSWRYGLLREEDQAKESIQDRANRQLLEMEDQLFGPSAVAASPATAAGTSRLAASLRSSRARVSRAPVTPAPMPKGGRFGEAMTFTEVGKKMQVSAEYTRRLCHKALNKLQQAAEDGTLEPALLC